MAWKELLKRFIVKSTKDKATCPCKLGVCASPPIPPSPEQREATLWTGGRFVNMLVMLGTCVHIAHIMVSSSHVASHCCCSSPHTSATLHISCLFDIQEQRQPGITSENIVLLCLETWSALTPPSPGRAPRPSQTCIQLTNVHLLQTVMKHVLGWHCRTSLILREWIYLSFV